MFQMAALQQMGKLVNPVSGEIDRDLQQAKASIDLIEMLAEKTDGNLVHAEKEFLDKILFELRMNYVDEVKRGESDEKAEEAPEPDKPSEDDSGDNGEKESEKTENEDNKPKAD
jgi:hypothetical protein